MFVRIDERELEEFGCKSNCILTTVRKIIEITKDTHWYMREMASTQASPNNIVNKDWLKIYYYFKRT